MGNWVTIGGSNSGNVAGGDLLINQTMPCKNGDGMLSIEDYERMPYCNSCIRVSRRATHQRFQMYAQGVCIAISVLVVGGYWWLRGHFPHFMGFLFEKNIFADLCIPIASTGALIGVIFLVGAIVARVLAGRYNEMYLRLHR